ncbi:FG-GAP repeat domain-containing protein [Cryptosporangium phraense]|uniref:FG-GAP repeat domain-containing protein n=1 Tax=Cryptosporangium phraense TaxID=2593070 RepID=UPI001478FCF5|nr:VCBS repeat-containing protein [Cryptosporangium phraense]
MTVAAPSAARAGTPQLPPEPPLVPASEGFVGRAGDYDGDGRDDVASFTRGRAGDVYVARSTGTRFAGIGDLWSSSFAFWSQVPLAGDFDGDGKSDVAAFARGDLPSVAVALSTGRSFGPSRAWLTSFAPGSAIPAVGDVNGDGKDDVLAFARGGTATVTVALSTGSGFATPTVWSTSFADGDAVPAVADVDGDGKDDVVAFSRGASARVTVALSTGTSFGPATRWSWFAPGTALPGLGDVDGDGKADLVAFARGTSHTVTVALSTGRAFGRTSVWLRSWATADAIPGIGDFDGDGRDDVAAFTRGGTADIFVALSTRTAFRPTSSRWHTYMVASTEIPQPGIVWERPKT